MNRTLITILVALLLCLPLRGVLAEEEIVLGEPDGEIGLPEAADNDDGLLGLEEIAGDIDMGSDLEIDAIELNADLSLDGADLPEAVEAPAAANAGDAEDVPLDEAHFPDAIFRKIIADWDNNPQDGILSAEERAKITEMTVDYVEIADLRGIEYFPWTEYLDCSDTRLTSLDVRALTSLKSLDCSFSKLTSLDVSGLTSLESLDCGSCKLTNLDVSGCTALKELNCEENNLTSLDVSSCTALNELDCGANQLTGLDVSSCTALNELDCGGNQLTGLDVSSLTLLEKLYCCLNSELTSLDLRRCTELTVLDCRWDDQLTSLDVSRCTKLSFLYGSYTAIEKLDISKCCDLELLDCAYTKISSLDVGTFPKLRKLDCAYTKISSLDASQFPGLRVLDCASTKISILDVSKCCDLESLYCYNTMISSLDISKCIHLTYLVCNSCRLKELYVKNLKELKEFDCSCNSLEILDLTDCELLEKCVKRPTRVVTGDKQSVLRYERDYDFDPQDHRNYSTCFIAFDTTTRLTSDGRTLYAPPSIDKCVVTDAAGETSAKLYMGDTLQLKGAVKKLDPETYTVIWSSSDEKVATVSDQGLVKAVGEGKCTITGKPINGEKGGFKVTVRKAPTSIALGQSKATLYIGKSLWLKKTVAPADAKTGFAWSSSDQKVATVDAKGKVTGVSKGTAVVTVKTDNGLKAACEVTVQQPPKSVTLNESAAKLYIGDTLALKATLSPKDAEAVFTWKSSDEKVATVSAKGVVKAVGAGKAYISVRTGNGLKAGLTVKVRKAPTSIALGQSKATLYIGKSLWLTKTVAPADAKTGFTWSSSDQKVATVDAKGKVTGVSKGTAVVTVKTDNGLKAACEVTVQQPPKSVTLNESAAKLYIGDTLALKATLSPKDAEAVFTWKSSDEKVATVSGKGVVKAVGAGKAYISVRTGNGLKAGLTVNVRKAPKGVKMSQTRATLIAGKTLRLKATVTPADAKTGFTWRSSDKKVATVDEKGVVTAVGKGAANITVETENGLKATCKVTVPTAPARIAFTEESYSVNVGKTVKLTTKLTPVKAQTTLTFSSSDGKIATVNSRGVVKGVKKGTATITVTTANGKTASVKVTVK